MAPNAPPTLARKPGLLAALALALTIVLAGCTAPSAPDPLADAPEDRPGHPGVPGDTASSAAPRPLVTFVARDYGFTGPAKVPAGWVDVRIRNTGQDLHHAHLLRLEDGHTFEEFQAAANSQGLPDWARPVGGPNAAEHGTTRQATMLLEPGRYVVVCIIPGEDGTPHYDLGMMAPFQVVPSATPSQAPQADMKVFLADFAFAPDGLLRAGPRTIMFENVGKEHHEAVLLRLEPGMTLDAFLEPSEGPQDGPPPFAFVGGIVDIVPGAVAYADVDLVKGRYGYLCFVGGSDTEPPHFVKGMRLEFDVA